MRIVVDTNRILSALLKDSRDRKIISSQNIDFFTLDYVLEEIHKYMDYIVEKSNLSKDEIDTLLNLFMENISIVPDNKVKSNVFVASNASIAKSVISLFFNFCDICNTVIISFESL